LSAFIFTTRAPTKGFGVHASECAMVSIDPPFG
jgi:hypothetical protein